MIKFNLTVICLGLSILALDCFAAEYSLTAEPNQAYVLEIRSNDHLNISVIVNDKVTSNHAASKPGLNKVFLTFLQGQTSQDIKIHASTTNPDSEVEFKLTSDAREDTLATYQTFQELSLVSNLARDGNAIAASLRDIINKQSLPSNLHDWSSLELSYLLMSLNESSQIAELNIEDNIFFDEAIFSTCTLLSDLEETQTDLISNEQYLQSIASLSFLLIQRQRHRGEYSSEGDANSPSLAQYTATCKERVSILRNANNKEEQTPPLQALYFQANVLLTQVLSQVTKNQQEPKYIALKAQWLFYFFQNMHIKAENVARTAKFDLEKNQYSHNLHNEFSHLLASVLMVTGQFGEALQEYREVLQNSAESDDFIFRAYLLSHLGYIYRDLGELAISERYFSQSLEIFEQVEGKISLNNSPCRNSGELMETGAAVIQLGILKRLQGDLDGSLTFLNCALDIFGNDRHDNEGRARIEIAKQQFLSNNLTDADQGIAFVLSKYTLIMPQKLDSLLLKLSIHIKQEQADAALITSEALAKVFGYEDFYQDQNLRKNVSTHPIQQVKTFQLLIELNQLLGREEWTEVFMEKAMDIIKAHQYEVTNPQAWNEVRFELIHRYLATRYSDPTSLSTEDKTLFFSLLDQHYSINPEAEKNKYQILSSQKDNQQLQVNYHQWINAEKALVFADQATQSQRYEADKARDMYLSYSSAIDKQTNGVKIDHLDLDKIQAAMPVGDVLLRYFVNGENSVVLIISQDDFVIRRIPNENQLSGLVDQVYQSIEMNQYGKANIDKVLTKLLPIEGLIRPHHRKLVIIPDHALHRLPFAVAKISDDEGKQDFLGEKFELVLTYSASAYYSADNIEQPSTKSKLAIFANPILDLALLEESSAPEAYRNWINKLGALPGSLQEANYIKAIFPENQISSGIGKQATNAFLLEPDTRNADILHIATHGYYQAETPEIVGLISSTTVQEQGVSSPGFLSINELLSKPVNSQLVVISGCDTMLGKYYKGSGMRSMTRGFIAQGAKSVIGTLWPIQDRATAEFMRQFYLNLKSSNGNSALALQLTRQSFATRGRYRSAKYWAGFVLTSVSSQAEKLNF